MTKSNRKHFPARKMHQKQSQYILTAPALHAPTTPTTTNRQNRPTDTTTLNLLGVVILRKMQQNRKNMKCKRLNSKIMKNQKLARRFFNPSSKNPHPRPPYYKASQAPWDLQRVVYIPMTYENRSDGELRKWFSALFRVTTAPHHDFNTPRFSKEKKYNFFCRGKTA